MGSGGAMKQFYPALIEAVAAHSVAARCGLRSNDTLLAINGSPVRDIIDVRVLSAESELTLLFERQGKRKQRRVRRRYGEPLGLEFATAIFDGSMRLCRNACDFCFVAQMPPGLRDPLYIKDDDYRLSFLHGNYITLTNLQEEDWNRIEEQFLSPLYVSVHATEPEVRVGLMHNPRAADILQQIERLANIGVEIHTQAVLVPGRNDGAHLDHTIEDLTALYPAVRDLSVVPVGLTRWHKDGVRPFTDAEAAVVLQQVLSWQEKLRATLGVGFVYPSDEWFLRANVPPPARQAYDELLPALIENGVGMVSTFREGWPAVQSALQELGGARQIWVTGVLFAPSLSVFAEAFTAQTGIEATILPVENHAFGETVTVAGLLTVGDILAALASGPPGDVIVLPDEIFRGPDGCALDGRPATDIAAVTGKRVQVLAFQDFVL